MSTTHPIKLMTLLAAAVLTTACQSKQATSAPSASTVPSSQKTSSAQVKSSESKSVSTTSASQASSSSRENKAQSPAPSAVVASSQSSSHTSSSAINQEASQTPPAQLETKTYVSQLDTEAILKGDYSTLVGTWANAKGETVVFDENGLVPWAPGVHMKEMNINPSTGHLSASVVNENHPYSTGLIIFPAGKVIDADMIPDERDHIEIGQSLAPLEGRYYKQ